jgi:hypothetical protein
MGDLGCNGTRVHDPQNPWRHNGSLRCGEREGVYISHFLPSLLTPQPLASLQPQPTFREKRDEPVEGVRVVQPAMQAKNRGALQGAPGFGCNMAPGHSQLQL